MAWRILRRFARTIHKRSRTLPIIATRSAHTNAFASIILTHSRLPAVAWRASISRALAAETAFLAHPSIAPEAACARAIAPISRAQLRRAAAVRIIEERRVNIVEVMVLVRVILAVSDVGAPLQLIMNLATINRDFHEDPRAEASRIARNGAHGALEMFWNRARGRDVLSHCVPEVLDQVEPWRRAGDLFPENSDAVGSDVALAETLHVATVDECIDGPTHGGPSDHAC